RAGGVARGAERQGAAFDARQRAPSGDRAPREDPRRRGAGGRAQDRMTSADPELSRLLIQELERHLVTLEAQPRDAVIAQRSIHALRGSAGLAGERELA